MFSMYFLAASALACDDGDGAAVAAGAAEALVEATSEAGAEAGRDPPPRTDASRLSHIAPPDAKRGLTRARCAAAVAATGALKRRLLRGCCAVPPCARAAAPH